MKPVHVVLIGGGVVVLGGGAYLLLRKTDAKPSACERIAGGAVGAVGIAKGVALKPGIAQSAGGVICSLFSGIRDAIAEYGPAIKAHTSAAMKKIGADTRAATNKVKRDVGAATASAKRDAGSAVSAVTSPVGDAWRTTKNVGKKVGSFLNPFD